MHNEAAAQRYYKARQNALYDSRRATHEPPTFDIGMLPLADLRHLMGVSQQQFVYLLETHTGFALARSTLTQIESGARAEPEGLRSAINEYIEIRKRGPQCRSKTVSPQSI